MAALRISFRILWKHIIKNFQVKHDQCDSILFLKTFPLESSKKSLLNLGPADSRILYFWQVLESIHKFIIELNVLQCLFVRGSNKKQRRGRIISNFISYLYQPSDNIAMLSPLLHPSKKVLSSPFSLGKKIIYLETHLKGELTDLFSNS